jgi:L-ectoine synthase
MIVRQITDLVNTERDIQTEKWRSVRLLLDRDNMGFSFHLTTIYANASLEMTYKNHLEAVYCISGCGQIVDHATKKTYLIKPGVMYALDKHDAHRLEATEEMSLMCVFNPPVVGDEVHRPDGSYAAKSGIKGL